MRIRMKRTIDLQEGAYVPEGAVLEARPVGADHFEIEYEGQIVTVTPSQFEKTEPSQIDQE